MVSKYGSNRGGVGVGGGEGGNEFRLYIRASTNGTSTTGIFPISSPNQVLAFRDYANANANFIVIPIGLRAIIERIIISGAPATGAERTTVNIQVSDDANAASPTFTDVANYTVTLSATTPPSVHVLDATPASGSSKGVGGVGEEGGGEEGGLLVIEPRATMNNNNVLSTTAIRLTWNQSAAHVAHISIVIKFV
ncbi:MAG: hypothetical protein QXI43_00310 [Candidatus Nitrosocaldus sp.]